VIEETQDRDLYAVDMRLDILRKLGVPDAGRQLDIYADQAEPEETLRVTNLMTSLRSQEFVAVATGSANPAKRYPSDLTAQVIQTLHERGLVVVLTAGPGESHFAQEILHICGDIPFLENARVPTLAALYRKAAVYVGPDSSTKHIAVACSIPTVTIFGPGNPANWNDSQNPNNLVLAPSCGDRPSCSESECAVRQCLRRVSPESIVQATLKLLEKKPAEESSAG
jgi:ADP-heptose:LPS heptosyltransferase